MAPSPLAGEGYAARTTWQDWVRGSVPPHPIEFADLSQMPSPARGEGANASTALVATDKAVAATDARAYRYAKLRADSQGPLSICGGGAVAAAGPRLRFSPP